MSVFIKCRSITRMQIEVKQLNSLREVLLGGVRGTRLRRIVDRRAS